MSEKFRARYEVDDGYCGGGSRPQYFTIRAEEIEDDMDDNDLEDLFEREMQSAFEQKFYPCERNKEEFLEWAREQRDSRKEQSE